MAKQSVGIGELLAFLDEMIVTNTPFVILAGSGAGECHACGNTTNEEMAELMKIALRRIGERAPENEPRH